MIKTDTPSQPVSKQTAPFREETSLFFFGSGISVSMQSSIADRLLLRSEARKFGIEVPEITVSSPDFNDTKVFKRLVGLVRRDQCRLFISSGVSSEAGMPDVQALRDALRAELIELGGSVPADATLPMVATELQRIVGRHGLIGILQREFEAVQRERPWERGAYPLIPRLCPSLTKDIFTTDWCDLLKRAFEEAGKLAGRIQCVENLESPFPPVHHRIYQVNGDIFGRPDKLIITSTDYDLAKSSLDRSRTLWTHAANEFRRYHFIFVGFRADDPNWALIRQALTGQLCHFLVAPMATETAAYLEPLGLLPVAATATDFFQALAKDLEDRKT